MNESYLVNEVKNAKHAFYVMIQMEVTPNVYNYNISINKLWKNKSVDEAINLFQEMHQKNIVCDIATYSSPYWWLVQKNKLVFLVSYWWDAWYMTKRRTNLQFLGMGFMQKQWSKQGNWINQDSDQKENLAGYKHLQYTSWWNV